MMKGDWRSGMTNRFEAICGKCGWRNADHRYRCSNCGRMGYG